MSEKGARLTLLQRYQRLLLAQKMDLIEDMFEALDGRLKVYEAINQKNLQKYAKKLSEEP